MRLTDLAGTPLIEPLSDRHDRQAFACGHDPLDRYLQNRAGQDQRRRLAVCYVATLPDENWSIGYYTLSNEAIVPSELPETLIKKLPRYPSIPATLLGRLAVQRQYQGKKLGEFLLLDAMSRSLDLSRQIASHALVVDAIDDTAGRFYARYGFEAIFKDRPHRLFMPMATIAALFG